MVGDMVVERDHYLPLRVEPQEVVEKPQMEKKTRGGVGTSTKSKTSSRGRVQAKWEEGAHASIPPGVRWGDVKP